MHYCYCVGKISKHWCVLFVADENAYVFFVRFHVYYFVFSNKNLKKEKTVKPHCSGCMCVGVCQN
jgi:hypothetical protein